MIGAFSFGQKKGSMAVFGAFRGSSRRGTPGKQFVNSLSI